MSTRPLTSTWRSLGGRRGPSGRLMACPERHFSCTPGLALRATFTETHNDELNDVLKEIQYKIILPAHLPKKQRKIVFNPKKRAYLEQNPIVIDVDGLEHKFTTIDRFRDVGNSKKLLVQALDKMQGPLDWANLPTLLAGYQKAGIKLRANYWGKVVRRAGDTGNIQTMMKCAKEAEDTGFSFRHREVAVRTLVYINDKMTRSMFNYPPKAVRSVELLLDLLQRPAHERASTRTSNTLPFSRLVRCLVLFARCSSVNARRDDKEKELPLLRDEVTLLKTLWGETLPEKLTQLREFAELNPTTEKASGRKTSRALNGFTYMQALGQSVKGIMMAEEILGDEVEGLVRVRELLEQHSDEFMQTAAGRCQAWTDEYNRVTATQLGKRLAPRSERVVHWTPWPADGEFSLADGAEPGEAEAAAEAEAEAEAEAAEAEAEEAEAEAEEAEAVSDEAAPEQKPEQKTNV